MAIHRISQAKVREICNSTDLSVYSYEECRQADKWVEEYALKQLSNKLRNMPKVYCDYITLMARCNYGSVETHDFLTELKCYPDWSRLHDYP